MELAGKVVALVGRGTDEHRALAVACAEAGARIALGTVLHNREQEYAVNSIANEVWSLGREHFVTLMDAAEPTSGPAFADECFDRFGAIDALITLTACESSAPIEELSSDEWEAVLREGATAAFLQLQALGRIMVREGGGALIAIYPQRPEADAAERAARAALAEGIAAIDGAWRDEGVRCSLMDHPGPGAVIAAIQGA